MTTPTIKIENIVASMDLEEKFDLEHIYAALDNADYDKKKFPGLVYRLKDPKTAFLLFASGKANCTGAKSIESVDRAIEKLTADLQKLGYKVNSKPDYVVQNIVAAADIGTELNLNAIAIGVGLEYVEYEPEVFPGLVYRITTPKVVVLIFRSGKLVITGAKTEQECEQAREIVKDELNNLGLL